MSVVSCCCANNKSVDCSSDWSFDPPTATDACCGTNVTISVLSTVTNGDTALAAAAADCGFIYDYNAAAGTGRIWGTGTDKRTKFPE